MVGKDGGMYAHPAPLKASAHFFYCDRGWFLFDSKKNCFACLPAGLVVLILKYADVLLYYYAVVLRTDAPVSFARANYFFSFLFFVRSISHAGYTPHLALRVVVAKANIWLSIPSNKALLIIERLR